MSVQIGDKLSGKIPIILERHTDCNTSNIRLQLMVPKTFTIADVAWLARKHTGLSYDQNVILLIKKVIPEKRKTLDQIYQRYADPDGHLYITYRCESLLKNFKSFSEINNVIACMLVNSIYSNIKRNSKLFFNQ